MSSNYYQRTYAEQRHGKPDELHERYRFHPPTPARAQAHELIRAMFEDVARAVDSLVPESRERACAQTALQESCLWSNAALAIHGEDGPEAGRWNS